MLDINYIREHTNEIRENIRRRRMQVDLDRLLELDAERRTSLSRADELRAERNRLSTKIPRLADSKRQTSVERVKQIKQELSELELHISTILEDYEKLLKSVPNILAPQVPKGESDEDNVEVRIWGQIPSFDFKVKDHAELGQDLDVLDFDRAAKVTGSKFYFLKGDLVALEFALIQYALSLLESEGFLPVKTPVLARTTMLEGTGYNPRGEETQIYSIADSELGMIATSEITLAGYLADEILEQKELPLLFAGVSECYRTEAGNYGRFSKGLYRVHHFDKVEMFAFTHPEDSEAMHEKILSLEEQIFQSLAIPYRVVDICDGDMGAVAYRKYDLEGWMPGRGENGAWGEITSCSNCTDYQARRLNIKFRDASGRLNYVHTLNGTAIAISRALIVIMENYQQKDGSIRVPDVLQSHFGKNIIERKSAAKEKK